jgi:hypothetical protein
LIDMVSFLDAEKPAGMAGFFSLPYNLIISG